MRGIGQKRIEMGIPLRGVERVCYAGARNDQGTKGERKVANSLNERARMAWRGWRVLVMRSEWADVAASSRRAQHHKKKGMEMGDAG
jgi:hypothetical protein